MAIIYPTNIIIWETITGKSWRVETSFVEPRVWAYDLDPTGHVISRIYFDDTASVVRQEQFPYGAKAEECYPRSWVLKRVPEHSYTPVEITNSTSGYISYHANPNEILVRQNCRKAWVRQFTWPLPDESKGTTMLSLAYDYHRGEWKVRENTLPMAFNLGYRYRSGREVYVLDDAIAFWPSNTNTTTNPHFSVDIYLSDEERWIKWVGKERYRPYMIGDMSPRHIIALGSEGAKWPVQVHRFMGIHERKALEERYWGKVEDAYGTLLEETGKSVMRV